MASARRHRVGFHNLKPLSSVENADSSSGTYYIQPAPEKKSKRCPNLCTMFWIFLVFCVLFLLGGFVGYYLREATIEEHGSLPGDGPRRTDQLGGRKSDLWLDPETRLSVHESIMYDITGDSIANNFRHLPDYANTMSGGEWDKLSALKVKVMLEKLQFDHVELHQHQVALSFPDSEKPNQIRMLTANGDVVEDLSLVEREKSQEGGGSGGVNGTEVLSEHDRLPNPYVAFSGIGSVKGALVYGHYGRIEDIVLLRKRKINTTNSIFLLRMGEVSLADKICHVKAAGAVGVLLYWDPADTHNNTDRHDHSQIPYASIGSPIFNEQERILVQTVSMEIAEKLFQKQIGSEVPKSWAGGLNVTYRLGTKVGRPSGQLVHLTVNNKLETRTIYNVVGTIHGLIEPDRYVYMGAPRTSFPDVATETKLSTAMLLSTGQALHDSLSLKTIQWVPRRTIRLCSWGGAEFSDLGMRLYMKERKNVLLSKAVVYLELSQPVRGNQTLNVTANPSLQSLIFSSAAQVPDAAKNELSLYHVWSDWEKRSTGHPTPPLSFYPKGDRAYPMFDSLGVSTISYQYAPTHNYHMSHMESSEVMTLESQDTQHHFRFHVAIARVTVATMVTLADAHFYSQFNMSDYGTYIFNRVNSLVDVFLENEDAEISKLIDSLQQVALRFLLASQTYELFTPAYIAHEDDLMVRRLNDHFLLLDRSLLITLNNNNNRQRHILSGSSTQDAFSTIGQHIELSRITRDWTRTISAVESLTQVLKEAALTLRVGE